MEKGERRRLLLDVLVQMDGPSLHLKGKTARVDMIPFTGIVRGEIFEGIVERGGMDTQILDAGGVRHLSARYMMTGRDAEGREARIFVENAADFADGEVPMPFTTRPVFHTDSPCLSAILEDDIDRIYGEGSSEADGLHIRFYKSY